MRTHCATHKAMRALWPTLGNIWGDAHTFGETSGDAQTLGDT